MDSMLVLTGLAVGVLVGLTGVGGGAVMTPALILYGIPPAVAVGTDLVYAAVTKSAGAVIHQARRNIHWSIVARLAAGSLPAAGVVLWLLHHFQASGEGYDRVVTAVLGFALVLTAVVVVTRRFRSDARRPAPGPRGKVTVAGGAVLGVLVAASSVGAGALGAALLLAAYPRLPMSGVVGTDIAHALLLATVAGLGHWHLGSVDLGLLAPLLVGSLPGVYLGARLTGLVPDRILAPVMALILFVLGISFSLGAVT